MSRRSLTVRSLAQQAGLDLDEALVSLWDAGIEDVLNPDDPVPARLLSIAQRALGISTPRELVSVGFWLDRTGLDRVTFAQRLADVGIELSPNARRLPKNALRRVRSLFPLAGEPTGPERVDSVVGEELPPLRWEQVGSMPPRRFLTEEEVCAIHVALVEDFRNSEDPILPEGVRDGGLLSSALSRPTTSFGGSQKYPTVEMAGAALVHSLVHNHPFHNGNKRTALVSLLAFLDEHGVVLTCSEDDLFRYMLRLGQHSLVPLTADQLADREALDVARWIRSNVRPLDHSERPLKWVRLKQRLREFGCEWQPAGGVGNRLNIWCEEEVKGRFRTRRVRHQLQVAWSGDGTDADRNTVHEIRKQLHLDNAHGVDSTAFYAGATIDKFIIDYRGILQRLARF